MCHKPKQRESSVPHTHSYNRCPPHSLTVFSHNGAKKKERRGRKNGRSDDEKIVERKIAGGVFSRLLLLIAASPLTKPPPAADGGHWTGGKSIGKDISRDIFYGKGKDKIVPHSSLAVAQLQLHGYTTVEKKAYIITGSISGGGDILSLSRCGGTEFAFFRSIFETTNVSSPFFKNERSSIPIFGKRNKCL